MKILEQIKLFITFMEACAASLLNFMVGDNNVRKEMKALRLFLHGGRLF